MGTEMNSLKDLIIVIGHVPIRSRRFTTLKSCQLAENHFRVISMESSRRGEPLLEY